MNNTAESQAPDKPQIPPGTLAPGEVHPAIVSALEYLNDLPAERQITIYDFFENSAAGGSKFSAICAETMRRLIHREVVGDRYAIGLAWVIHTMVPDSM